MSLKGIRIWFLIFYIYSVPALDPNMKLDPAVDPDMNPDPTLGPEMDQVSELDPKSGS